MKKKRAFLVLWGIILAVALLLSSSGCKREEQTGVTSEREKPVIAVTIVPQQTFVEAVCGDLAEVITLVPPGNSPENYEPTPQQMEKFNQAEVYFTIGVATEEASILPNSGDVKVVSLAEAVKAVYPERQFPSGERDPHIWLSPKRVEVMVETIAAEMSALDPENKTVYENNAKNYIAELKELDQAIKTDLAPVENKKFIVYHPAFGYLADDYGLTMVALEEEGKEATAKQLQTIIDLAKAEQIKVIFYQEEIDSRQSQAFADELGGKTIQLAPLAANYSENLKNMAKTMAEVMK